MRRPGADPAGGGGGPGGTAAGDPAAVEAEPMPVRLDRKVAFLRRPESYPEGTRRVEAIETHIAWVFLTDEHAYKLKKPVRHEFLDFTSLEARRRDCEEELRLNRRLAPDVYLGLVPLALRADAGRLSLGGPGEPVEWLVRMRRLPHDRMLDRLIEEERLEADEARRVGRVLGEFYRGARRIPIEPAAYRARLRGDVRRDLRGLLDWEGDPPLPPDEVREVARLQLVFVDGRGPVLDRRAREGRIVEGHADLRPEHVHVPEGGGRPAIIDCVEFEEEFRILDAAHDLAFLALECERLGAGWAGEAVFAAYGEVTGDEPPGALVHFYRSARAILRAKLAVWHLRDHAERDHWTETGETYLRLARRHIEAAAG